MYGWNKIKWISLWKPDSFWQVLIYSWPASQQASLYEWNAQRKHPKCYPEQQLILPIKCSTRRARQLNSVLLSDWQKKSAGTSCGGSTRYECMKLSCSTIMLATPAAKQCEISSSISSFWYTYREEEVEKNWKENSILLFSLPASST